MSFLIAGSNCSSFGKIFTHSSNDCSKFGFRKNLPGRYFFFSSILRFQEFSAINFKNIFFLNPSNDWWKIHCIERVTFAKIRGKVFEFPPMMLWASVIQLANTKFWTMIVVSIFTCCINSDNEQTVPIKTDTNLSIKYNWVIKIWQNNFIYNIT